ncbi:MAG: hypothetical protein ABI354_03000 [Candidatus Saccharimonadales bacterium]
MLALEFFSWWYTSGWLQAVNNVQKLLTSVGRMFSVPILIRTWVAPWRRIISYPGAGIDAKLRAVADNLISRTVGFFVRTLVLITALLIYLVSVVLGFVWIIFWPLLPITAVALLLKGIIG